MYKVTVPVMCEVAYKYKEATLKELKRGGANRVAVALDRELPFKFSSEETLSHLKELLAYFEENGLETLVWLGQTLGHERFAPPVDKSDYAHMVNMERGELAAFCPNGEAFKADVATWVKKIAKCGAKIILLDDDFRLGQGFGCCCRVHMAAFEKELGENVRAESLKDLLMQGGRNKYRDAWLKVQGDSMKSFAKTLREALDTVDPEIRMGLCLSHMTWDEDGTDAVELARILAGKTKPLVRPFGAPYHGGMQCANAERERTQLTWLQGEGIETMTEGDTYPRPRFACPAAHLECFDTILRADGRADGILKYMIDYCSSPEYETGYVDFAEKNAPLYREIEQLFDGKTADGVVPYLVKSVVQNAELNRFAFDTQNSIGDLCFDELSAQTFIGALSLPSAPCGDGVKIIFGESARYVTAEQLKDGAILDIVAEEILRERGFDTGCINAVPHENLGAALSGSAVERYIKEGETVAIGNALPYDVCLKDGARVLTKLSYLDALGVSYLSASREYDFAYEYENAAGQRFLVFPLVARRSAGERGVFKSYSRKRLVSESIAWLNKKPLGACLIGNFPQTYLMTKKGENSRAVGLWNLFDDKAENLRVRLDFTPKSVRFVNCTGHTEGNDVIVDSTLYPYEFAGFEAME